MLLVRVSPSLLGSTLYGDSRLQAACHQFTALSTVASVLYPSAHITPLMLQGSLDAGKPWEELSLRMLLKHALPGSTVVDVGVNFGTFALWLARAVGPEGRLVGFEPQTIMHMVGIPPSNRNSISWCPFAVGNALRTGCAPCAFEWRRHSWLRHALFRLRSMQTDGPAECARAPAVGPSSVALRATRLCSVPASASRVVSESCLLHLAQTASANMVINNHVNVELHHAAVGHRAGSISMAAVEEDGGRAVDMKQARASPPTLSCLQIRRKI